MKKRQEMFKSSRVECSRVPSSAVECHRVQSSAIDILSILQNLPHVECRDMAHDILATLRRRAAWRQGLRVAAIAATLLALAGAGLLLPTAKEATQGGSDIAQARSEAVEWLASQQRPDGTWDVVSLGGRQEHAPALMGLALMTIAEQQGADYGRTLQKGIRALLETQQDSGCFGGDDEFMLYNHGIATVALLRLCAQEQAPRDVRPALEKAVEFIRTSQLAEGGWGYRPDAPSANVSVSAWQLEALGIARHLGWEDSHGNLRRGLFWLTQLVDGEGTMRYQQEGGGMASQLTTTAQGIHCLLSAGAGYQGVQEPVAKMAQRLHELLQEPGCAETDNPYRDYFIAQAMDALRQIPAATMRQRLLRTNVHEGDLRGSWDAEDMYSQVGGRLCSTSFSAMALK